MAPLTLDIIDEVCSMIFSGMYRFRGMLTANKSAQVKHSVLTGIPGSDQVDRAVISPQPDGRQLGTELYAGRVGILAFGDDKFGNEKLPGSGELESQLTVIAGEGRSHLCLLPTSFDVAGGIELIETLRARGTSTAAVLISAYVDVPMAVLAMKSGIVNVLQKPFSDEELFDCVQQRIDQGTKNKQYEAERDMLRTAMKSLSPREREVMDLVVEGQTNKVVAKELGVNPKTVEKHRAKVMLKMNAASVQELVRMAYLSRSQ